MEAHRTHKREGSPENCLATPVVGQAQQFDDGTGGDSAKDLRTLDVHHDHYDRSDIAGYGKTG